MNLIRLNVRIYILMLVICIMASGQTPTLFFTDITSGPATGGENGGGAYVTLYGNYFGASQGASTITLNRQNCLRVVSWGTSWLWYQKIVVQLQSGCSSGNFSITVNGQPSQNATIVINGSPINPAAFIVRSGNIYCVSTGGSDSNNGKFPSSCWATMPKAVHTMVAGDITYVENGVFASAQDPYAPYNAAVAITSQGSAGSPISVVAYPGASSGINTSQQFGIRTPLISGPGPYWNIAGLQITADTNAFSIVVSNIRIVGNTMTCPNGNGYTACGEFESAFQNVYGNELTLAGVTNGQKEYHGFYFEEGDNHTDFGWNSVHNVRGCRGVQFYSSAGNDMYDLHVHDNLIHDIVCDGINFSTVNPGTGVVEAFNNIEYKVGTGPDPSDGASNYTCINTNSAHSPTVPAQIYNNVCMNAGRVGNGDPTSNGGFSPYIPTVFKNNLIIQTNNEPYFTQDAGCSGIAGSQNNDFYGNGPAPVCTGMTGSLNVNPQVVSTSTPDFHLTSSSPLINAGVTISTLAFDHDGITRPQGPAYDIGAYEYYSGSGYSPCDLNYDGVVDSLDVQIAVSQGIGETQCTNGDLDEDGICNVVDVQRVIDAAMGQGCRVGP
jgi:hypothetical protein